MEKEELQKDISLLLGHASALLAVWYDNNRDAIERGTVNVIEEDVERLAKKYHPHEN